MIDKSSPCSNSSLTHTHSKSSLSSLIQFSFQFDFFTLFECSLLLFTSFTLFSFFVQLIEEGMAKYGVGSKKQVCVILDRGTWRRRRLYNTILYCTILYHTIPYFTILYYTILYYTILYYTILYHKIL